MSTARYVFLDAGRGLAALVVLWHHVMVFYGRSIDELLAGVPAISIAAHAVSGWNTLAVAFFFVISGWSIQISTRRLSAGDLGLSWRSYMRHRVRRIVPIYCMALVWSFLMTMTLQRPEHERSLLTLLGNLAFLQTPAGTLGNLVVPFAGNGPLWSLSFEFWYYLALPLVYPLLVPGSPPGRSFRPELAIALCMLIGLLAIGLNRIAPNPFFLFATLWPVWLAGFVFGRVSDDRAGMIGCLLVILVGELVLWGISRVLNSDALLILLRSLGVAAGTAALAMAHTLPAVKYLSGRTFAQLLVGALAFIGGGSYSIYVLHYPLIMFLAAEAFELHYVAGGVLLLVLGAAVAEPRLQRSINRLAMFRDGSDRDTR